MGLVASSFFIYACAALIVASDQYNDFTPERSSIAAAISNVAYGAPLGKVYSGVLAQVLDFKVPLDKTLAEAARQEVLPGNLLGSTMDGNGIGYIVVASLSMRLLGLHTLSIVLAMLTLMGVSAMVFSWRFPDRRAVVVILYFSSLTIMLFTPLVWQPAYSLNMTIGGIRYFSLVAILPAFHLLLECADSRGSGSRMTGGTFGAMSVQVVVLVLAILVRNSAAPIVAAVGAGCFLVAWLARREPGATTRTLRKAAYMTIVGTAFVGLLMLSVSKDYLRNGRFTETVWHRIFVSLGLNPAWPYGNVREMFDCSRYIPEGLVSGGDDRNGHCIWMDYAIRHNIPVASAVTMTYDREYDKALREAFFKILRLYPREVLETFFYEKPQYIVWSIAQSLDIKLVGVQPALRWLLVASLVNLLAFTLLSPISSSNSHLIIAGATILLAAFSTLPYIAVWAMPHTSGDLLLLSLFGLGLTATAIFERIRSMLLPRSVLEPTRSMRAVSSR
jgi:tetrahydromethanopterin S-methyltransferase subunit B